MKKILILLVALMMSFSAFAGAQDIIPEDLGVKEPTLLPSSPFYFIKEVQRNLQSFFTFSSEGKAELNMQYASEKLMEARKLAEGSGNEKVIKKATEKYEKAVEKLNKFADKLKDNPKADEFFNKFTNQQALHNRILEQIKGKVPQDVQEKVEEAKEKHLETFSQVMQKLGDREDLPNRLKNTFQNIKKGEFDEIENLSFVKDLFNSTSTDNIKPQLFELQEKMLLSFKEKFSNLDEEELKRLVKHFEDGHVNQERALEIIEDLKQELGENPTIHDIRDIIFTDGKGKNGTDCNPPTKPSTCEGRLMPKIDDNNCVIELECIEMGELPIKPLINEILPDFNIEDIEDYKECYSDLKAIGIRNIVENKIQSCIGELPNKMGDVARFKSQTKNCLIDMCPTLIEENLPQSCTSFIDKDICNRLGDSLLEPKSEPELTQCTAVWDPVCGQDNKTYSNTCWALISSVDIKHKGTCDNPSGDAGNDSMMLMFQGKDIDSMKKQLEEIKEEYGDDVEDLKKAALELKNQFQEQFQGQFQNTREEINQLKEKATNEYGDDVKTLMNMWKNGVSDNEGFRAKVESLRNEIMGKYGDDAKDLVGQLNSLRDQVKNRYQDEIEELRREAEELKNQILDQMPSGAPRMGR